MISDNTTNEIRVHGRFSWSRLLAAFLVTVLLSGLAAGAFLFGLAEVTVGRALPGVSVAGVSIGGLDRAAAISRLRDGLPPLSAGSVVLVRGESRETIPYAELGRDYDYEAIIGEAVAFGRTGSVPDRALDELRGLTRGHAIGLRVTYDRSAVEAAVARIAPRFEQQPSDAWVRVAGNGTFTTVPGVAGREVDRAALVEAIVARLATTDASDVVVEVPERDVEPVVTTAKADAARLQAERMTAAELSLTTPPEKGKDPATFTFSPKAMRGWVAFTADANGGFTPTVITSAARTAVAKLAPKVAKAPKDATYLLGNGKVVGSLPGVDGRALDVDRTLRDVEAAMSARTDAATSIAVTVAVMPVKPELSSEEAAQTAPLMKMISSWTTNYEVSERNFWSKNITTPALKINGYVVEPGAIFNFWNVIGDPRGQPGYGPGGAIIEGHSQPTGAWAGGICSCSTTLFNAAVRAGLEIIERHNHYYYITRYPVGLDATVSLTDGGGGQNMIFRNDTPYPILIHSIAKPGVVTFQFYSIGDGRTTTFATSARMNYTHAGDSVQYTTDLAPGAKKRVEFPTDGFNVTVTRVVKDKDGNVIHEDTFYSHYATVTGVLLVGKSPDAPPTDQPTEPPTDQPVEPTPSPEPTPVP